MPLLGLLVGHRVAGSIGSAASYLGGASPPVFMHSPRPR
jgi:hypothetical protein